MADTQTLELDPYAVDETQPITIAPREWFYFKAEVKDQLAQGNGVDLLKALHAARYYAMLDRSFKQIEEGKVVTFTDEEWEAFVNAQDVH